MNAAGRLLPQQEYSALFNIRFYHNRTARNKNCTLFHIYVEADYSKMERREGDLLMKNGNRTTALPTTA